MSRSKNKTYDIIIVGGGMVGASLARALSPTGMQIAVIEAVPLNTLNQPSFDDRAIALSYGTRLILQSIGIWDGVEQGAEPIHKIHVSEQGQWGFARLDRAEEGVDALGYVVTARHLGHELLQGLEQCTGVDLFCPASLSRFTADDDQVNVSLQYQETEITLAGRLLVAADGADSKVREQLVIPVREKDYGQVAVVTNVKTQLPHQQIAYERFTPSGPVALLPMQQGQLALVYTIREEQLAAVMQLDDAQFIESLQQRFGYRLGRIQQVGRRQSYDLKLREVTEHIRPRVAIIGNAAHTVHPVAGQGFNLGIRDVAVMADVLAATAEMHQDPGQLEVLERYVSRRKQDHRNVLQATDTMVHLFANPLGAVRWARNAGILAVDMFPSLKHRLARFAMGLNGHQAPSGHGASVG